MKPQNIAVDILDIHSLVIILKYSRRGDCLQYFSRGFLSNFAITALKAFGIKAIQLSPASNSFPYGTYQQFHEELLEVMFFLEEKWFPYLESTDVYPRQLLTRVVRFASQHFSYYSSLVLELILSVTESNRDIRLLLMRKSLASQYFLVSSKYSSKKLVLYNAPILSSHRQTGNKVVHCRFDLLSARYGAFLCLRSIWTLVKAMAVSSAAKSFRIPSLKQISYDALVYLYQSEPYPGFSEAFWVSNYISKYRKTVLGLVRNDVTEFDLEFYKKQVSNLVLDKGILNFCFSPESFVKRLLVKLGQRLWFLCKAKLPLPLLGYVSQLEVQSTSYEILLKRHQIKSVVSFLQGPTPRVSCALMLASMRHGAKNFGSTWSSPDCPGIHLARAYTGYMFHWGNWQLENFLKSKAIFEDAYCVGYPTWELFLIEDDFKDDHTPEWLTQKRDEDAVIVSYYPNVCGEGLYLGCKEAGELLHILLDFISRSEDIILVVKGKRARSLDLSRDVELLWDHLMMEKRLYFEDKKGDLTPGLYSDVVVGIGPATLPIVARAYSSVKLLVYDRHNLLRWDLSAKGMSGIALCSHLNEIEAMLKKLLQTSIACDEGIGSQYKRMLPGAGDRVAEIIARLGG